MHRYTLTPEAREARWNQVLDSLAASTWGWPETVHPVAERPEPPREAPRWDPTDPDDEDLRGRPREPDPETSNDGEAPELPEAPDRGGDEPTRTTPR